MDIPKIANLKTAIEMRREILKLAIEKNCPEEDLWLKLETYRKTHKGRTPIPIVSILGSLLSKMKVVGSPIEEILKIKLEAKKIKFKTHKSIGRFFVDFFLLPPA